MTALDYSIDDLPADGLSKVSELARELRGQKSALSALEAEVAAQKTVIKRIEEQDLPAAMSELGLKEFTLTDGTLLSVREEVCGGISELNSEAAFAWLRKTGNASIIKRQLVVVFGRGEDAKADAVHARLSKELPDSPIADTQFVHPQTLKAFVREQLAVEADNDKIPKLPREVFGVWTVNRAIIKQQ